MYFTFTIYGVYVCIMVKSDFYNKAQLIFKY